MYTLSFNTMTTPENNFYKQVFLYLIEKHGKNSVEFREDDRLIAVSTAGINYFLSLSGNENKIYFITTDPELTKDLPYKELMKFGSFRVFRFEEAKKYIDFKAEEQKLISSIEG